MTKNKSDVRDTIRKFERVTQESDRHDAKKYGEARDAVLKLGDALNGGSREAIAAGVVEGLLRTHRYLSNEVVVAFLTALGELGALPEAEVSDPRNKFAYELCQKLRRTFRDELFWRDA